MRYRTKEESIADFLREEIISGKLPRGTRLKQRDTAARLNSSITPVREAFRILKAEHYLAGESHLGMVVAPFSAEATPEIRDLRVLLEGRLLAQCVTSVSKADLDELRMLADEFEAALEDPGSSLARGLNYQFHQRMYEIANMPQTLQFVQMLWASYPFDLINQVPGRVGDAAKEHRELLEYLIAGDAPGAIAALREHINQGWQALEASIEAESHGR